MRESPQQRGLCKTEVKEKPAWAPYWAGAAVGEGGEQEGLGGSWGLGNLLERP